MKLTYKVGVFVPSEAVHVPEGYVVDVSLPELTPEGNVKGSGAAMREFARSLRQSPPLDPEAIAEFTQILIDAGFYPKPDEQEVGRTVRGHVA